MATLSFTSDNLLSAYTFRNNPDEVDISDLSLGQEPGEQWQGFDFSSYATERLPEFGEIQFLSFLGDIPLFPSEGEHDMPMMSFLFSSTSASGETRLFVQNLDERFLPTHLEQVDVKGTKIEGYQVPDYQFALGRLPGVEAIDPNENHIQSDEQYALRLDGTEASSSQADPENRNSDIG